MSIESLSSCIVDHRLHFAHCLIDCVADQRERLVEVTISASPRFVATQWAVSRNMLLCHCSPDLILSITSPQSLCGCCLWSCLRCCRPPADAAPIIGAANSRNRSVCCSEIDGSWARGGSVRSHWYRNTAGVCTERDELLASSQHLDGAARTLIALFPRIALVGTINPIHSLRVVRNRMAPGSPRISSAISASFAITSSSSTSKSTARKPLHSIPVPR